MALCLVYIQQSSKVPNYPTDDTIEKFVRIQTGLDFHGVTDDVPSQVLNDVIILFRTAETSQSKDFLGDSLEIVLSFLNSAGRYGQFRTPSHIAQFMARTTPISKGDVLLDPAAGTGGFLVAAVHAKTKVKFEILGDEVDQTMVSVARANILLAGRDPECIRYRDALDVLVEEADVILANPPFSGRIVDRQSYGLTSNSNKSEILFVELIMRRLKRGGITSFIIPSGLLTNTDKASFALRKQLVEEGQVLCVIELPRGVFRPYTDVLTAIVYWKKSERTLSVPMFRPMSDGFTLDDRREPIDENQLFEIEEEVKDAVNRNKKIKFSTEIGLETLKENSLNLLPAWYQEINDIPKTIPGITELLQQATDQANQVALLMKSLIEGHHYEK
jgi:type I restriction enzyme M protein